MIDREALIAEWDGTQPLTREDLHVAVAAELRRRGYRSFELVLGDDGGSAATWLTDEGYQATQPLTLDDIRDWANGTFGVPTLGVCIKRAAKEWDELMVADEMGADESEVAEEAADVLITLCNSPEIVAAAKRKMAVNRDRKWTVHSDGTGQHVKEGE